jgi:hypothetical protein
MIAICVKYGPTSYWSPFQNDSVGGDQPLSIARSKTTWLPLFVVCIDLLCSLAMCLYWSAFRLCNCLTYIDQRLVSAARTCIHIAYSHWLHSYTYDWMHDCSSVYHASGLHACTRTSHVFFEQYIYDRQCMIIHPVTYLVSKGSQVNSTMAFELI